MNNRKIDEEAKRPFKLDGVFMTRVFCGFLAIVMVAGTVIALFQ